VARISGNPIFPAIVEALFQWAAEYYQAIVRAPGAEDVTLAEHQRLFERHRRPRPGRGRTGHARPPHARQRPVPALKASRPTPGVGHRLHRRGQPRAHCGAAKETPDGVD
jgi:hypothetical protein